MKLIVLSTLIGATAAFAPASTSTSSNVALRAEETEETVGDVDAAIRLPINGWVPDGSKPLYGLPGAVSPTGFFDPVGFCQTGISLNDVKRYREAEV